MTENLQGGTTERLRPNDDEYNDKMKDPINKRIREIFNDKNISETRRVLMIREMIDGNKKRKQLWKERQAYPAANKTFLSGSGNDKTRNNTDSNNLVADMRKVSLSKADNRFLPTHPNSARTAKAPTQPVLKGGKKQKTEMGENDGEESETESGADKKNEEGAETESGEGEGEEEGEEEEEEEEGQERGKAVE